MILNGEEKNYSNIELVEQLYLSGQHLIFILCVLVLIRCLIGHTPRLVRTVAFKLVYRRTEETSSERRYDYHRSHSITTLVGATGPI